MTGIIIWQDRLESSDWFFLGQDFAIRTVAMETVISCVFFLFSKAGKFKICSENCKYSHSSQRNYLNNLYFTEHTIRTRKKNFYEANFIILEIWKRLM